MIKINYRNFKSKSDELDISSQSKFIERIFQDEDYDSYIQNDDAQSYCEEHEDEYAETDITNSDIFTQNKGDIFDLANAFLCIDSMTHKKLQKLCYYAKAWYLALYDENIIEESFEAWIHGAVQPELYQKYKSYGFGYISKIFNTKNIPEEFLSFTREVYQSYGHLDGDELERLNHSEAPWINARGNLKPWQSCEEIINEEDMKLYYRKIKSNENFND